MPNHSLPTTKYPELFSLSKDKTIGDKCNRGLTMPTLKLD
jgi:hypothetical protein